MTLASFLRKLTRRREPAVLAQAAPGDPPLPEGRPRKLKIVVVGAHPDDPETGCGGTIARYAEQGHAVVVLYLTRGEAGIREKSREEAGPIRAAEAQKACSILGATPRFADQSDARTEINPARYEEFGRLLMAERPDIVFTHWPIDAHRDHRAAGLLAYDAWLLSGRAFALLYFEVVSDVQTQGFRPTHYVDISTVEERKKEACLAHESQGGGEYAHHERMHRSRGGESGFKSAEAFVHLHAR